MTEGLRGDQPLVSRLPSIEPTISQIFKFKMNAKIYGHWPMGQSPWQRMVGCGKGRSKCHMLARWGQARSAAEGGKRSGSPAYWL